jgi:HAD superfamily hydrolase (TIGR01549 family)
VLLFDLDDTLLRFSAGQPNFWRLALEQHLPAGSQQHTRQLARLEALSHEYWSDSARAFWGRQNMQHARRAIARGALEPEGIARELCERIADEMTEGKEAQVRPFEGALEVLQQLRERGHRLGLLTNGSASFQRRKLQRFALEPLFELILIEGELGYGKPDARVFRAALEHFAVAPSEAWMIGDNLEADIAGAQQLGLLGVWHDALGHGLPERPVAVPRRVIRQLSELLAEAPLDPPLVG